MDHFDALSQYMHSMRVPEATVRRVKDWCQYTWDTQKTFDEMALLDTLPKKVRTDVALDVHYRLVRGIIFKKIPNICGKRIPQDAEGGETVPRLRPGVAQGAGHQAAADNFPIGLANYVRKIIPTFKTCLFFQATTSVGRATSARRCSSSPLARLRSLGGPTTQSCSSPSRRGSASGRSRCWGRRGPTGDGGRRLEDGEIRKKCYSLAQAHCQLPRTRLHHSIRPLQGGSKRGSQRCNNLICQRRFLLFALLLIFCAATSAVAAKAVGISAAVVVATSVHVVVAVDAVVVFLLLLLLLLLLLVLLVLFLSLLLLVMLLFFYSCYGC